MNDELVTAPTGQLGVSEALRRFTEELPLERKPILDFVQQVAADTRQGSRVLDLGAGDAPYRELFAHADYVTNDWEQSEHAGAREVDIVASAESLPVSDGAFDLVLCTQVLEHVPEPGAVLAECFRVLAPGGRLAVSAPLIWELHEAPHDYYRYTEFGLRHLVTTAGFTEISITPRGSGFATIAQLARNLGWALGDASDGLRETRVAARKELLRLSEELERLAPLDAMRVMPLGYSALARRP